jgi:hypothetical protein
LLTVVNCIVVLGAVQESGGFQIFLSEPQACWR